MGKQEGGLGWHGRERLSNSFRIYELRKRRTKHTHTHKKSNSSIYLEIKNQKNQNKK
jgi:anti-sigma regulatory factor (Ser/Thr protein kinase)